ncbi:hypothetical protein GWK47_048202 [Chionoecetes opilio]|uniref:Uncharacterized protein n=1 Tax=Chionoecetes opilio TaxID=41210 RepID=A0A8J4YFW4_CHIOP|nr:hypothetical protein GWK47_048202 [Chionoecetes opilio]
MEEGPRLAHHRPLTSTPTPRRPWSGASSASCKAPHVGGIQHRSAAQSGAVCPPRTRCTLAVPHVHRHLLLARPHSSYPLPVPPPAGGPRHQGKRTKSLSRPARRPHNAAFTTLVTSSGRENRARQEGHGVFQQGHHHPTTHTAGAATAPARLANHSRAGNVGMWPVPDVLEQGVSGTMRTTATAAAG